MITEIRKFIEELTTYTDSIPEERKHILNRIAEYVSTSLQNNRKAELIYVCTHNSRRSHFGQVWGRTAAEYYGIKNVNTYSAGTEATSFNPNAIKALEKAGFYISKQAAETNPKYEVYYDMDQPPELCFSKTYQHPSIPTTGLCAIMTCTEADGNCPYIPGTELRISCPYDDPKAFDGTALQDEKYEERCRQIALENLYVFKEVSLKL
ncbi:MAG: protein-tyrosine-phosphatase [Cytophagaceae bacterium]